MALTQLTQLTGQTGISTTIDYTMSDLVVDTISVGGTITYNDVTSVDSIGIITARKGIQILGDGINVTGIATVGTGLSLGDDIKAQFGNSGDLKIYHDSSSGQSLIEESGPSVLKIKGSNLRLSNSDNSADYLQANDGAAVKLFYNGGAAKFETTSSGSKITGQLEVTTGANSFLTSANVFKGTAGQKGVYLRSALSAEGTPSYSSVDDTNTGMFLPGSDVCAFTTGGTERLRITSDGQVQFSNGSFASNIDSICANGGTMEIGAQSTLKFRTATNEVLRITGTGQFHMGGGSSWTYANQKFVVVEGSNPLGMLLQGNNANQGVNLTLQNINNNINAYSDLSFADDGGQIFGAVRGRVIDRDNNHGEIHFHTSDGTLRERLRIKLDGAIKYVQHPTTRTNTVDNYTSEGGYIFHYVARTTSGADRYRRMFDIASVGDNTWGSAIRFSTNPDSSGTTVERMRITHQGFVGINNIPTLTQTAQLVVKNSDDANLNTIEAWNDNGNVSSSLSQTSAGDGVIGIHLNAGSITTLLRSNGVSYFNGGDVGIGSAFPTAKLDVLGNVSLGETLTIKGDNPNITFVDTNNNPDYKIYASNGAFTIQDGSNSKFIIGSTGTKTIQNGNLNILSTYIDFSGSISTPATAAAIFRPADNTLAFSTANEERLRINSTGQVGIGTGVPDQTLELFKESGTNLLKVSSQANSTIGIEIEKTGSTTQSWRIADGQTVNGTLEFHDVTEGETRLAIDGNSRVIVGQASHAGGANFVVCGNANTQNAYGCAAFAKIGANPTSGTTLAQLRFSAGSGGTNRAAEISVEADSNWSDGTNQESKMIFKVASNGGGNTAGSTPAMTLKGNGNVEVHRGDLLVNSPTEDSGRITVKGTNTSGSTCYAVTNSGKAKEGIDVTCTTVGANNYGGAISFGCGGNGRSAIAAVQTGSDDDRNGLSFFTHGSSTGANDTTERLRIDAYGSLNIGSRLDQNDDLLHVNSFGRNIEAIGIGASSQGIRLGWKGDNSAYDSSRIYRTDYSTSEQFGMGASWPCMVITPTTAPGSGTSNETVWLKSTGTGSGSTQMHLTVDGTTVIGGNGEVNGGTTSGYPNSRRAGFGDSKLTIQPNDRTSAFDAATGSTWHDVVIKQSGSATNNAVGIAFEVSSSGYHHNAGTGIAAVKNGNSLDYGSDLVFITRPQSAVAAERMRITSTGEIKSSSTGFVSYIKSVVDVSVDTHGWSQSVFYDVVAANVFPDAGSTYLVYFIWDHEGHGNPWIISGNFLWSPTNANYSGIVGQAFTPVQSSHYDNTNKVIQFRPKAAGQTRAGFQARALNFDPSNNNGYGVLNVYATRIAGQ